MIPESSSPPSGDPSLIKIFNWEDIGTSINSDTRVMRYMKLSTFLLLLDGGLFIPTIRLLQTGDRLESRVPKALLRPNYGRKMRPIVEPHEQLLLRTTRGPKVLRPEGSEHSGTTLLFLAERWLHELALRRCVWCWNQSTDDLYALWKLYGERGVAVLSTVGRIRNALEKAGAREGIVAPVRYARRVWKMIKKFREQAYDIFHQRTEVGAVQIERISCFGRRQHLNPDPSFWIATRL